MKAISKFTFNSITLALCFSLGACAGGKSSETIGPEKTIPLRQNAASTASNTAANTPETKPAEAKPMEAKPAEPTTSPTDAVTTPTPDKKETVDSNRKQGHFNGSQSNNDILNNIFGGGLSLNIGNMFDTPKKEASAPEESANQHSRAEGKTEKGEDTSNTSGYFSISKKNPYADAAQNAKAGQKNISSSTNASTESIDASSTASDTTDHAKAPTAAAPTAPQAFSPTGINEKIFTGENGTMSSELTHTNLDALQQGSTINSSLDKLTLTVDGDNYEIELSRVPSADERKDAEKKTSPITIANGLFIENNSPFKATSLASDFEVKFGLAGDAFDEENRQFYVQGKATDVSQLPTGSARYQGGAIVEQDGTALSAAISADVNFATKKIGFELSPAQGKFSQVSPALNFEAQIDQNHFAGKSGSVTTQGAFYGDNAKEIAGFFLLKGDAEADDKALRSDARGVFGLKK